MLTTGMTKFDAKSIVYSGHRRSNFFSLITISFTIIKRSIKTSSEVQKVKIAICRRQDISRWSNMSKYTNHNSLAVAGQQCQFAFMMTSSNGNIFRVTGLLCREFTGPGEFPTQRPVTRSFDVFFDLRLNKRLSKQPWGWWFKTPSWSLWRHCNVTRGTPRFSFYDIL